MTRWMPQSPAVRRIPSRATSFLSITLALALLAGAAGAATGTRSKSTSKKTRATHARTTKRTAVAPRAAASTAPHAMKIAIDPETGRMGPPTPAQAAELENAAGTPRAAVDDDPARGIRIRTLPDGTKVADLDERFMESALAVRGADGKLHFECVHGAAGTAVVPAPAPAPVRELR
jgi:hypothetical protein